MIAHCACAQEPARAPWPVLRCWHSTATAGESSQACCSLGSPWAGSLVSAALPVQRKVRATHGDKANVVSTLFFSDSTKVSTIGRDQSFHRVIAYVPAGTVSATRQKFGYVTIGWLPTFVLKELPLEPDQRRGEQCALAT